MTFLKFKEEYQRLKEVLPLLPTHNGHCENCEYGDYLYGCSNSCFCFDSAEIQDCLYCFDNFKTINCIDNDYCQPGELLYDCLDCFRCYNSAYLNYCARMYDSYLCWDCTDSHNLFGCTHLSHKQYCIFNKQYSKEEYSPKVRKLLKRPLEENIGKLQKLIDFFPMSVTNVTHSENSDYCNHVHYSKDMYFCFDCARSEDCAYSWDSNYCKSSYDLTYCYKCELSYECNDSARLYNCHHMDYSSDCYDSAFCSNCLGCHNCFGCVNLKNKKYCILNKPCSKGEYERIVGETMESFRQLAR